MSSSVTSSALTVIAVAVVVAEQAAALSPVVAESNAAVGPVADPIVAMVTVVIVVVVVAAAVVEQHVGRTAVLVTLSLRIESLSVICFSRSGLFRFFLIFIGDL